MCNPLLRRSIAGKILLPPVKKIITDGFRIHDDKIKYPRALMPLTKLLIEKLRSVPTRTLQPSPNALVREYPLHMMVEIVAKRHAQPLEFFANSMKPGNRFGGPRANGEKGLSTAYYGTTESVLAEMQHYKNDKLDFDELLFTTGIKYQLDIVKPINLIDLTDNEFLKEIQEYLDFIKSRGFDKTGIPENSDFSLYDKSDQTASVALNTALEELSLYGDSIDKLHGLLATSARADDVKMIADKEDAVNVVLKGPDNHKIDLFEINQVQLIAPFYEKVDPSFGKSVYGRFKHPIKSGQEYYGEMNMNVHMLSNEDGNLVPWDVDPTPASKPESKTL